jgi:hypothetical protein
VGDSKGTPRPGSWERLLLRWFSFLFRVLGATKESVYPFSPVRCFGVLIADKAWGVAAVRR